MKNFTTVVDELHQIETTVTDDFSSALVGTVEHNWDQEWTYVYKDAVPLEDVKAAYDVCIKGTTVSCEDLEWILHKSYYWLVKRTNGSLYPFPLMFEGLKEREQSASTYNGYKWDAFYEGRISSDQLEKELVDVPTEEEINGLLSQLDQLTDADESPWDDLDARGGLVPRWAA